MRILLFLLMGLWSYGLFAQEGSADGTVRDGIFLEGGGHGILWSFNYERTRYYGTHWATHGRIGLGLAKGKVVDLLVTLPLTFSASYGGSSRAELGLGAVPYLQVHRGTHATNNGDVLIPVVHAGYRYQEPDGQWFLRAGALVSPVRNVIRSDGKTADGLWNPYLSIGLLF